MLEIPLSANTYNDYWTVLRKAVYLRDLQERTRKFVSVAPEACERIMTMTKEEFTEFRHWFVMGTAGIELGADLAQKWNPVAAPTLLLRVHKIAYANKIPWGTAFAAAKEQGFIEERDGNVYWREASVLVTPEGKAIPKTKPKKPAASKKAKAPATTPETPPPSDLDEDLLPGEARREAHEKYEGGDK